MISPRSIKRRAPENLKGAPRGTRDAPDVARDKTYLSQGFSSSTQVGSRPLPVSRKLLRLDSTAGQPLLIISKILLPSSNSSCVTVSRVCPLIGLSSKVTRDGGSCGRSL